MGLDFRLSRKGYELFTGNGRVEFNFLREFVKSKGDDFYGEDILLTKEDIHTLIKLAYEQFGKGKSKEEFDKKIVDSLMMNEYMTNAEELVAKLMLIDSIGNYTDYYIECDW